MDVMLEAMRISFDPSQGLKARMWKAIAIRIANVILMNVPTYQSWSQEKIKYHLERAFVPTLTSFSVFLVNDLMEDVLLIEGQAMDANSRYTFFAPTYIPRTVQKIFFPNCSMMNVETPIETKLLIIPAKDIDEYEIMETAEQVEMVSNVSSKCLQHLVRSRASPTRSHPSRRLRGRGRKKNMFGFSTSRNKYDKESHMTMKSSIMSSFAGSRVFPAVESSFGYPTFGENWEPTQNQFPERIKEKISNRSTLSAPKDEEKPADTSLRKDDAGVPAAEQKSVPKDSGAVEQDIIDDIEEIILPFRSVPMADLTEEEEDDNESYNGK